MKIPWSRGHFLRRRTLDRLWLDLPDAAIRALTGRSHWPPYSLRAYVGGAADFGAAGEFFLQELRCLRLLRRGTRILDVGCGCGRIALALASDPALGGLDISYTGMDVDRASIQWCQRRITPHHPQFRFYQVDLRNISYNPQGSVSAAEYRFPHPDSSFDLILLTSVLTHTPEGELRHYLEESARLLSPGGTVYATFFLYPDPAQLPEAFARHGIRFPGVHGHYAVSREDRPTDAIAYQEAFVREAVRQAGLAVLEPAAYGAQDLLLLTKPASFPVEVRLGTGWHPLEKNCWRWTERCFTVHVRPAGIRPASVLFDFRLAAPVLASLGPIRLRAWAGDAELGWSEYSAEGAHVYRQALPAQLPFEGIDVRFELDRALPPSGRDGRELGVQVQFFTHCAAGLRELQPIRVEPGASA